MNAAEIEEAVTDLAAQDFDAAEFAFSFLQAFGNKETTIKKLRSGTSNGSNLGGILQRNNIHDRFGLMVEAESSARLSRRPDDRQSVPGVEMAWILSGSDGCRCRAGSNRSPRARDSF